MNRFLDIEAAWRSLSASERKQLGKATIAYAVGEIASLHLGNTAQPGHHAARHQGIVMLRALLTRNGIMPPDPKKALIPDLSGWVRQCRECGCIDDAPCGAARGGPCHWVEKDLCSCCAPAKKAA